MRKICPCFFTAFGTIFIIDQAIKFAFLNGFRAKSDFIDLILVFNDGVAFSMFAFLGEYLKFVQILLIGGFFTYLYYEKTLLLQNPAIFGAIFGAGVSNLTDRFIHGGVVDYVFWHKWFEFAVFNFADVAIDVAIATLFLQFIFIKRKEQI